MNIGFLLDDSLDRPDGVQQYVLTLGQWFEAHGHTVHYLVGQTERTDIKHVYPLSKNIRVKFNGNVVGTPLPASKKAIESLLGVLKLDVLHVQLPYSPLMAGRVIAAIHDKTAVVGTLHIYPNTQLEHGLNKLLTQINKQTLKRFDTITAVSDVAAEASHLLHRESLPVVPNPVHIEVFQKPRKTSAEIRRIIFLGRLVERKGCLLLLQALHLLETQNKLPKQLKVTIAGDGPLRPKLEQYVTKHGLEKRVNFAGFLQEASKASFLQKADLAVYPSTGGESFGIVLIEAMAAGALTLGGNNEGYRGVLGSGSPALFSTKTPVMLAELIQRVLENEAFRNKLHKQQQALIKQYDVSIVGNSLSDVYKKALLHRHNMG
jgi:phosphatidyl-myo-inositol alpha-mannosyltransferase